ncbi:MAG: DUF3365 domain-containing protein [Planctomycetales bacterium]|nr:DUF3365 domain-containing protein [Planctomycetales bacterium]
MSHAPCLALLAQLSCLPRLFVAASCCLLALGSNAQAEEVAASAKPTITLEQARDRSALLHKVYATTLDVMHDRYFHGERAMVPARAMQDVFDELKRTEQIEAKWIAVSLRAMSVNHEPETKFEKQAARQMKAGKRDVEQIDDAVYRRAFAIPLSGGCIHCHDSAFTPSTGAKFAGLVLSMPIQNPNAAPVRTSK